MQKTNLIHNKHNKNEIDFGQLLSIISASKLFIISITIAFTLATVIINNYFYTPTYTTSALIKIGVYAKSNFSCVSTSEFQVYCRENDEDKYEFLEKPDIRLKRLNLNFFANEGNTNFGLDGASNIRINHTSKNAEIGISVLSDIITYMQDKDNLKIQNIIQNRKHYLELVTRERDNQQESLDKKKRQLENEKNILDEEKKFITELLPLIDEDIERINQRIISNDNLLNSLDKNEPEYFEKKQLLISKNDNFYDSINKLYQQKLALRSAIDKNSKDKLNVIEKMNTLKNSSKYYVNQKREIPHLNLVISHYKTLLQNSDFKKSEVIGKTITTQSTQKTRNILIGLLLGLFLSICLVIMKQIYKEKRQTA